MTHYRLGVPVKIMGASGLRSHDSRRWQNKPHLSVSLAYVRDVLAYLNACAIHFYRLSGQLAPYLTHPDLPQFHYQIEECANELAATGDLARHYGIRLTLHPGYYVRLSSPDPSRVQRSQVELSAAATLLDAMGLGPDSVIVIHVGGVYEGKEASLARFASSYAALDASVRARLALENDDRHFGIEDTFWLHRRTGIPLVLDTLHHQCISRTNYGLIEALALALPTWPSHQTPKIHFSSPRTALRQTQRQGVTHVQAPLPNQHADFADPFVIIELLRKAHAAGLRPFDIMLELKAKDLALLRLRKQIARFAPDLEALMA